MLAGPIKSFKVNVLGVLRRMLCEAQGSHSTGHRFGNAYSMPRLSPPMPRELQAAANASDPPSATSVTALTA